MFDLFNKKKKLLYGSAEKPIYLDINDFHIVSKKAISEEIDMRKNYYCKLHLQYFGNEDYKYHTPALLNDNFTVYVAPHYEGTTMEPIKESIRNQILYLGYGYPLYYHKYSDKVPVTECVCTNIERMRRLCTDIHVEPDIREGYTCAKYIVHCYDNENDYDIYFMFYSGTFYNESLDFMFHPVWRL